MCLCVLQTLLQANVEEGDQQVLCSNRCLPGVGFLPRGEPTALTLPQSTTKVSVSANLTSKHLYCFFFLLMSGYETASS